MKSDEEILTEFQDNVSGFLESTSEMRSESALMYRFRDCHQVDNSRNIPEGGILNSTPNIPAGNVDRVLAVVNLAAPYVRSIAGMFLQESKQIQAYSTDPEFSGEGDVMSDAIEWAQYVSRYNAERTLAYEDALTAGVGAHCTYLDFSHKAFVGGVPRVDRKFFLFYDLSGRGSDINSNAAWCGYCDPMTVKALDAYIEKENPKLEAAPGRGGFGFQHEFMAYTSQQNEQDIEFLYHPYWYDWTDVYDTENPYVTRKQELAPLAERDPDILEALGVMSESLQVDLRASYWSLDKDGIAEAQATMENISKMAMKKLFPLEFSRRKAKCYYKAEIARGKIVKKSQSFCQKGHALNFMTAYFDETKGYHYGLMRPLALVQELLNDAISDYATYAKRSATGGNTAIKGAGEALQNVIKAKLYEKQAFPIPPESEIVNLGTPDAGQAMLGLVNFYVEMMPKTLGLPPEWLGMLTTGDMTSALFGQIKRQMNAVLAHIANNSDSAVMNQGNIFVDLVKVLADTKGLQVLPRLSPGHQGEEYFYLTKQNLARDYSIRTVERKATTDEMQDQFDKWADLLPAFQPEIQNALVPMLIQSSNFDEQVKKEALERIQPKPAPPDPLAIEERKSGIAMLSAQAMKLASDSRKTDKETLYVPQDMAAIIEKNIAQAAKYAADAGVAVHDSTKPEPKPERKTA